MLRQRIITGLALLFVVLGTILFADNFWVRVLIAAVLFAATRELLLLTLRITSLPAALLAALFVVLFWISLGVINPLLIYWQSVTGLVLWVLITLGLLTYRYHGNWSLLPRVVILGIGLDLLWICVHGLVYLQEAYGGGLLLYLFSLVWIADIGAYFSGRKFGKHKLAPAISPGKTWEGLVGGLLANIPWIICAYQFSSGWGLGLLEFLLISLSTSLISVVGDLFESILKREAGVKDSGKLLPGHGGMLDRVDSVIAAAPVFVAGFFIVGPS